MFRFENPEYLFLILLIPVFATLHYLWNIHKRRQIRKFGDQDLVRSMMIDVSRLRPELKFWLLQASLLCMIIAIARPQYGTKIDTRERKGIEAIIALDVSNSMLAQDVKPDRLEKSKMMVSNLVDNMTDDKVGLIVYAGQAFTQLPITSDYVSAKMFLETISPQMIDVQGTDIATAINLAMKSFTPQEGVSRAIFIITDGEDNEGGAIQAAKEAAKAGVHVYVLGIGSPDGAPIPVPGTSQYIIDNEGNTVVSHLNEQMCRDIAVAGNGNYIYVDNSSSAQEKLFKYVDQLGKANIETQMYSEFDEQFQGFVILSIILLILSVVILERENHIFQKFTFFTRQNRSMVILLIMTCTLGISISANAQNERDYIRRGNRLMRYTVDGKNLSEKAQVQYQKAIEKDGNCAIARYNLGNALVLQSKAKEAMEQYELATRFEKDKKRLSDAWHNMGVILQAAKQYDKAISCYKNALRNDPNNDETRYNYVLCQRQLKNQPQDQNQDQQQNQDQDKQQQQQQQQKQQQKKDDGKQQQQQPKENEMSKENAEQMLKAAQQSEKNTQEKIQRQKTSPEKRHLQKQW